MHETSILNSTVFWYCIAVFIFAFFAVRGGKKPLLAWLDSEIARVRTDLDEAKRLRAEAQATLAEYVEKQKQATHEAENIIQQARADAAKLREQGQADLRATLERNEQLFINRIKLVHEEAIAEVRAYVIDEALNEARGKLNKIGATADATMLIDQIIDDLPKLSKKKAS